MHCLSAFYINAQEAMSKPCYIQLPATARRRLPSGKPSPFQRVVCGGARRLGRLCSPREPSRRAGERVAQHVGEVLHNPHSQIPDQPAVGASPVREFLYLILLVIIYCSMAAPGKCIQENSMMFCYLRRSEWSQLIECSSSSSGAARVMSPAELLRDRWALQHRRMAGRACKQASSKISSAAAAGRCGVATLLCTSSLAARQCMVLKSKLSACNGVQRQHAAPTPALVGSSSFTQRQPTG